MWWPFGNKSTNEDPVKALEGLKKSREILEKRFEKKEISNAAYLEKAMDIQKQVEKYEKQIKSKI